MDKSEIARTLNSLRKTHGGPALKPGTAAELERRRRKREAQQRWRQGKKTNRQPNDHKRID